ncbi:MAG: sigma-70 family RNA polymerase sigma factor [Abitibacteriaceae bacterium]|nr:sigma-70 family RNA polymerase sigma factor [Abditibacteriaceae bacterium]
MQDYQLLQEYTEHNSQAAFAALVEQYVGLVYSTALREVCNAALAEDVTQVVFIILARKAAGLRKGTILGGWLFHTTRFVAKNALQQEARRQQREQKAAANVAVEFQMARAGQQEWDQIEPLLHRALATLRNEERNAVLLRFFEGKTLKETGQALGISEDAAQKRVARALDKLRRYFSGHGYAVPVMVLGGLLYENAVRAAPLPCSAAIMHALWSVPPSAVATGSATGSATASVSSKAAVTSNTLHQVASHQVVSLTEGALKAMLITQIKVGVVASLGLSLTATGVGKLAHQALAGAPTPHSSQTATPLAKSRHLTGLPKNVMWKEAKFFPTLPHKSQPALIKPRLIRLAQALEPEQTDKTELAELQVQPGEIRIEGRIDKVNADNNQFVLSTTSFTLPNGKVGELAEPKPKTVVLDKQTIIHVRGDKEQKLKLADLTDLQDGIFAIAVGKDLGSSKNLPAREVAVWDRIDAGLYHFKDYKLKVSEAPDEGAASKPKQPALDATVETDRNPAASPRIALPLAATKGGNSQAAGGTLGATAAIADPVAGAANLNEVDGANLLPQGNFEEIDARGKPVDWVLHSQRVKLETDDQGKHYMVITGSRGEGQQTIEASFICDPKIRRIKVLARMRVKKLLLGEQAWQNAHVGVIFYDQRNNVLGYGTRYPTLNHDSDWTMVSAVTDVIPGTARVGIDAGIYGPGGELAVTDISVVALPVADPFGGAVRTTALDRPNPNTPQDDARLTQHLLTQLAWGKFDQLDAKGLPVGWMVDDPEHTKVLNEGGNHFLRLNSTDFKNPLIAQYRVKLDPAWKGIRILGRVRAINFMPGQEDGDGIRIASEFEDAAGNAVVDSSAFVLQRFSPGWSIMQQPRKVPEGATTVILTLEVHGSTGPVDFDDIMVVADPASPEEKKNLLALGYGLGNGQGMFNQTPAGGAMVDFVTPNTPPQEQQVQITRANAALNNQDPQPVTVLQVR